MASDNMSSSGPGAAARGPAGLSVSSRSSTVPADSAGWIFGRALRAEVTKLVTLRLTAGTLIGTVLLTVGLSWGLTALIESAYRLGRPADAGGLAPGSAFLVVLHYGQIGVILLGAWMMHQEADSGSLRTTALCVPQRGVVFLAKGVVLGVTTLVVALLAAFGLAGVRCLATTCSGPAGGFGATPGDELRILLGVAAYWTLIALLTYALAVLLRSGIAAMAVVLALALVVSVYLLSITGLAAFLPDQAGSQLYQEAAVPGDLGPVRGGLVLVAWTAVATLLAYLAFRRQPVRA